MRRVLKQHEGERRTFTGRVGRFGCRSGWKGAPKLTLVLEDVRDGETGELMADHVWFDKGVRFASLCLRPGDRIRFTARIAPYHKAGGRRDFRLSFPASVSVLERAPTF